MAKSVAVQDDLAEMVFPYGGLQLTRPFLMTRRETTQMAENVRFFEMLTGRGRGGSRPGLSRFIDEPLGELVDGICPIQHLTTIVTVDGEMIDFSFDGPNQMFPGVYAGIGFIDISLIGPFWFPDFGIVDGIPFNYGSGYPPENARKKKDAKISIRLTSTWPQDFPDGVPVGTPVVVQALLTK